MIDRLLDSRILFYCMVGCGFLGAAGLVWSNYSYRKRMRLVKQLRELKEKWIRLWKNRDTLLHHMNRWVWYPSLVCIGLLLLTVFLNARSHSTQGVALSYVYVSIAVPMALLLLRQALDLSYRNELLADSVADYIEEVKDSMEEKQVEELPKQAVEEMVDHITRNIKESAVTKGHFAQMLSPEEEAVMRDVIREFMD